MVLPSCNTISSITWNVIQKHYGEFYRLNCLHSFRTVEECKSLEKDCMNNRQPEIVMPNEENKTLKYCHELIFEKNKKL